MLLAKFSRYGLIRRFNPVNMSCAQAFKAVPVWNSATASASGRSSGSKTYQNAH
jgi:hypothetical protein